MKSATRTRSPRPGVLGVLLFVAVLSACDASACDLGGFEDINPFPDDNPNVSLEVHCADDADSGPIPTETTLPPGSEPLSGDAVALAAFYNATDGPNWSSNTHNWLTDAPISDWGGVTVNGRAVGECVVTSLSGNQLSGTIPPELGNLAHLESLNLYGNQLSGTIPAELGNLANLEHLDLSGNRLSGEIPAALGNLLSLPRLDLSGNQLSGEIPAALGNLANLEHLDLSGNRLSGEIPAALGNLLSLPRLDLSVNQLSGAIPAELGNLLNLGDLRLSDNQLSGAIPAELANLSNLTSLNLSDNHLSGVIPAELANLFSLPRLDLSGNQLSGAIPAELGNLLNLESLSLNGNQLSGTIPAALGNLANLEHLDLSGNQLSGAIPAALGNLLSVRRLDLSDNQLSGTIPAALGNLLNLEYLSLSGNQLSGEIPAALGNLLSVRRLDLSGNQLSEAIPAGLGNLPNLLFLDLSGNQLSGEIPAALGKIPNLGLDGNHLSGRILRPNGTNLQYAREGSTIRVSWDAVDGADYYKVYHDDFFGSSCSLGRDGSPSFCEELATNVVGTAYVHTTPNRDENYYWVVSCNSDGCSEIASKYPAITLEARSTGFFNTATPRLPPTPPPTQTPMPEVKVPANVRYAWDGSTIRVSWDEVPGADYYNVYYDDSSGGVCLLRSDGSPSFCDELATNVVGTTYVHTDPDSDKNYYWVFACNSNGCSDTDSPNPATPIETRPNGPANVTHAFEGSAIRVTWEAVPGADYYKVYHDDFFDDVCSLRSDGSLVLQRRFGDMGS